MSGNLSVNGPSPADPKKKPTAEPFVGTRAEFVKQAKANVDIGYELVNKGQCTGGKTPDGTKYALCPGGIFTHKEEDGKVEMHAIETSPEGFKDYYTVAGKDLKAAGCVDQNGKKCE